MKTGTRVSVAVIGTPDYPDAGRRVYARLRRLKNDFPDVHFHIVADESKGPAESAIRSARKMGMSITVFTPDWDGLGKDASLERSLQVIDAADRMIAFWDMRPGEVGDTIKRAILDGIHVEIYDWENEAAGERTVQILGLEA